MSAFVASQNNWQAAIKCEPEKPMLFKHMAGVHFFHCHQL
jgi:hypothetical protein